MKKQFATLLFCISAFATSQTNPVASRLQWMNNSGYCGETSLISAGLYYGQYVSQYDVRAVASKDGSQTNDSLLLGVNDTKAAQKLHLQYEAWDTSSEQNTEQFLIWLKQKVVSGYPVAIGIYANQYLLEGDTNPNAGDADYDHIVHVTTISSQHSLTDPTYYGDDFLGFCDNGLWENQNSPVYYFSYAFDPFQQSRSDANAENGPIYSLSNDGSNYGIAITGVADLNGDTLPVRVDVNYNFEEPAIRDKSNTRPNPMPLTLTITVSDLQPDTHYVLYRYNRLESVPESKFNANASQALQKWDVFISSGSTYSIQEVIQSNETAVYRCVKASAP